MLMYKNRNLRYMLIGRPKCCMCWSKLYPRSYNYSGNCMNSYNYWYYNCCSKRHCCNNHRSKDTGYYKLCRKHNILMRYFLSNIRFVSCHSFGILSLANDLDMETFALSLCRIYLCILHPNNINDCSIFCSLRVLYIRHRSVLVLIRSDIWNSVVNIVYTEDSGIAILSVRLCDHK